MKYDPAEEYSPLTSADTPGSSLVRILLDQAAPFIPKSVLERRDVVADELLTLRRVARGLMVDLLKSYGVEIDQHEMDGMRTIDAVCKKIPSEIRNEVRSRLCDLTASLTPELIERLGLMPEGLFDRRQYVEGVSDRGQQEVRHFHLLREIFPDGVNPQVFVTNFEDFDNQSSPQDRSGTHRLRRIAEWMVAEQDTFRLCVRDAFDSLNTIRKYLASNPAFQQRIKDAFESDVGRSLSGAAIQPFELFSDLYTNSPMELVEIILNPNLQLRLRVEAMILMEWALGFYSARSSSTYKAQIKVQGYLHKALKDELWDETMELPAELFETSAGVIPVSVRKVQPEIQQLLSEFSDVLARTDAIGFRGRPKLSESIVIKLILKMEEYKRCLAYLDGAQVEGIKSEDSALARLADMEKVLHSAHPGMTLPNRGMEMLKFFDINMIRDKAGLTFALILKKRMADFTPQERERVDLCFKKFGELIAGICNLGECQSENQLWNPVHTNGKRSSDMADYKVFGGRRADGLEFVEGRPTPVELEVPVEVQLHSMEVHLRVFYSDDDLSYGSYRNRKFDELGPKILPLRVGGEPVI